MQPDPLTPQEVQQSEPAPTPVQETKVTKRNLTTVILAIFLVVLLIVVAGLGFWAYQLNSNLIDTQQQLTALQGEHTELQADYTKLKGDNEKLTGDLGQSKADLEKTSGDLTTAQAELKKSQDQNKGLQTKTTSASKKAEILYAFSVGSTAKDILAIDTMIKATNDQELIGNWNNFVSAPTAESSTKFLLYLIGAIRDELK